MSFFAVIRRVLLIGCMGAVIVTIAQADELLLVAGGGKGSDGGSAIGAAMGQPFGMAIDAAGNLFIADFSEHRVRKVDTKGVITTVGGTGEKGFSGDGGPAVDGQFNAMHDLVLDRERNIYIADSSNLRVRKIEAKTGILSTVAGNGEKGVRGDGGPGAEASLDGVASLFFAPDYTKLYLGGFSGVVRVLDMKSGVIDTVKGLPGGRSIAVDSKGNIYVAGGSTLRILRPDGTIEVLVDKKKAQPGEVTIGDNTKHLGFDADENVFIADDFGHAIKKYVVAEKKVILIAGTGERGTAGVGGPPLVAQLDGPHGVYFHPPTNTLYIGDSRNKRVLKLVTEKSPTSPTANQTVVPLFDLKTEREPATVVETADAIITQIGDRVRGRHAREAKFRAYDEYNTFYWEYRTIGIEIVDRVAKGGDDVTFNITSLWPLNTPDFRAFYVGKNTVAEYAHNVDSKQIDDTHYTAIVKSNSRERRPLRMGDVIEFEFSPFLVKPPRGRANYYGSAIVYVVGRGVVPWYGVGEWLDPEPLPETAWLGGHTTLPYQYSDEPNHRLKQMATNIAPRNAQPFMLGRRLHHTDFGTGAHSEKGNPQYEEQAGKLGPQFVATSCIACHVNNGRALPPETGKQMLQSVVKVGADQNAAPHLQLGTALQPQSVSGKPEAAVQIAGYDMIAGKFADGESYELRKPRYDFSGVTPSHFSVRLTPQLVGLGLLEAIPEAEILAAADPDDADGDGISGRALTVLDPQSNVLRVGRFGYKASQPKLLHQIAGALNTDMGVTTSIFPIVDHEATESAAKGAPELADEDLDRMYRYVALLGVPARRDLDELTSKRGEKLFVEARCAKCHASSFTTSEFALLAELRSQKIQPYTDLLLHDLGAGLSDTLGDGSPSDGGATGAEWRTPPLWGIGLTAGVSGGEAYLHDGRARTLSEAILWHDGEAAAAKKAFVEMSADDRSSLIRFLKSL
ncbi:NHL repeat protein [Anatilimnocola aggregata]|uniref:NHL repeat protein n=1 Tax=Anatilimnocola aggregata TaxID=2528021 RepID=A0A517YCS1_9BACT|nr:di-heme oxidoredictase family protein [Anatilimnocola aggregata]QDU28034.1 NHL repeat protein [Anatilimnocola aggregata]